MTLPSLKELRALLKILRDNGVTNYNTPELQLNLIEQAPAVSGRHKPLADETLEDEEGQPSIEEIEAYINGTVADPPKES